MEESILTSIKKILGITEEYEQFDADIIMHINSVFMVLQQLGVGPKEGFTITDKSTTWGDYLMNNTQYESAKSYIGLKVRLLFDPPLSSTVMECMKQMISEMEWRLNVQAELSE